MPSFRVFNSFSAVMAALILSSCSHEAPPAPTQTFAMGDKAEAGHLIYRVFDSQWMTQIPQDPSPRIPQNRFLLVHFSVTNGASGEVLIPGLTLESDDGQSYAELSSGEGVPQWIGILRKVKAGASLQGNVLFDAPPQHYKLRVTDESGETTALIDLPLNLTTEAPPQILIPQGKQ